MRDFHKICRVCTSFQDALVVKISFDLFNGLLSYGGFKLTVSGCSQIFSAPWRRNYASDPRSFRGARTCSRSSITMPSLAGLGFHPPAGQQKTLSFLSVCLSVRHASVVSLASAKLARRRQCCSCIRLPSISFNNRST